MISSWLDPHGREIPLGVKRFNHKMAETGLFSDDALIRLIDKHPDHLIDVTTLKSLENDNRPVKLITGDFRGVDALTIFEAAKVGDVHINLRQVMKINPVYSNLLKDMYASFTKYTGLKPVNAKGGLVITASTSQTPYHCDKTETVLWHIRGKKRVYVYPKNEKMLPEIEYEKILKYQNIDDLPYTSDYDRDAVSILLGEGEAITWPLNAPHRVENESFCVSVTTEYSTAECMRLNAETATNAMLRKMGFDPKKKGDKSLVTAAKIMSGVLIQKARNRLKPTESDMVGFELVADDQDYIQYIEPFERNF